MLQLFLESDWSERRGLGYLFHAFYFVYLRDRFGEVALLKRLVYRFAIFLPVSVGLAEIEESRNTDCTLLLFCMFALSFLL